MEKGRNFAFFRHEACEYFPCHEGVPEEDFNCLFCYCPLYALGEDCGGDYVYTAGGIKSCEACAFPHRRENYAKVIRRFPELANLAGRQRKAEKEEKNEKKNDGEQKRECEQISESPEKKEKLSYGA